MPPYISSSPENKKNKKQPNRHLSNMSKLTSTSLKIPLSILSLLFLILPFHGNSQTIDQEQTILLKLRHYWSDPRSINHWKPSPNSNSSHCDWPEITCTDGLVTGLALIGKNINRGIPPFICDLKNLTVVDLQYNFIPGPFPTVLYNCSKLEILDLSHNCFIGLIPDDIHRLSTRLRSLNLSGNSLTGDIPAAIGRFPELRTLGLSQNEFNGSFTPEIGNLSSLEILDLSRNEFTPMAIPSSFSQLKKLEQFFMTESRLIEEIPETIGNLTALEILDLSKNDLSGTIPSGLFLLKYLTTLYLYSNRLSGAIPRSVEALNLEVIDLSENNLTGTIPDDFGRLTKLYGLALFSNQLSGEVPESIGRLPSLEDVKLFSNNLSGVLPPDFGRHSRLRNFQVSSNHFSGKLPEYLCAYDTLLTVDASHNNLSGKLPNFIGNCFSLISVQVQGNRFSGNIRTDLWLTITITYLDISNNSFTGGLPYDVGSNLSHLDISNNKFSGEITDSVYYWRSLSVFQASNNLFSGSIPQELTSLPLLTTLLLDRNQLSGQLYMISWNLLTTLNLSQNQLSGPIPAELGFSPALNVLDLSQNEFSGQIPPLIGNLRISSLNLSSNHLTGRIPVEFESATFDARCFLNNPGLCANNPLLGLHACPSGPPKSIKISFWLFVVVVCIAVVSVVSTMLLTFFIVRVYQKRKHGIILTWKLTPFHRLNFEESDIVSSLTENNVIGSGGSGKVYLVAVNRAGKFVAVKRIWNSKKLDENLEKEFLAEVQILGTIRHSNIVKLLCCISSENSKLLVYEYLENRSLDLWLHGKKRGSSVSSSFHHVVLDWPKRLQIAVGAARGLCYMHHGCSPPFIHRDVKSSNILLDSEFNAKIADFGLAKALVKHGEPNTMSAVAGTFGYIAPEYVHTTRVNEKIDVYSFGVVLLELATGREANYGNEDTGLAEWAWRHFQEGNAIVDALDEEVKEPQYLDEMNCVFKLGIICTGTLPSTRPSMKKVLQILLCCSQQLPLRENNAESNGEAPLLTNSRHERMIEDNDDVMVLAV